MRGAPGTWQHLAVWDGQEIALEETLAGLPRDDASTALAIRDENPQHLHYRHISGWHAWDGRCHAPDDRGLITAAVMSWASRMQVMLERAKQAVTARVMLAGDGLTETQLRKAIEKAWEPWVPAQKYAAGLFRNAGRTALESYLARVCEVPEAELDERWPELLNVADGVLDLRSGQLWPHDPAAMISYCVDVPWRPQAKCPMFWDLLMTVCGGNPDTGMYLLRLLGYALLGDNREQLVVFLAGPTNNGKSTLLHIISEVLGPVAEESKADLICVTKHGRNARTENSIRDARLVTISETSDRMIIEDGQLKRLSGDRMISVDQHYAKKTIRTPVTWLIMVATNEMPSLASMDEALRRRIVVVPGGPTVPAERRDPLLDSKILAAEREGILALLAWAAGEYLRDPQTLRQVPAVITARTEQYAHEQDTIEEFLADCCTHPASLNGHREHAWISIPASWKTYKDWAGGNPPLTRNQFHARMAEHPAITLNSGSRRYEGIAWKPGVDAEMFG